MKKYRSYTGGNREIDGSFFRMEKSETREIE